MPRPESACAVNPYVSALGSEYQVVETPRSSCSADCKAAIVSAACRCAKVSSLTCFLSEFDLPHQASDHCLRCLDAAGLFSWRIGSRCGRVGPCQGQGADDAGNEREQHQSRKSESTGMCIIGGIGLFAFELLVERVKPRHHLRGNASRHHITPRTPRPRGLSPTPHSWRHGAALGSPYHAPISPITQGSARRLGIGIAALRGGIGANVGLEIAARSPDGAKGPAQSAAR